MDEPTLFLKRVALIAGSVALVIVAVYGAYFLFTKNVNTGPAEGTTALENLSDEEKVALLNQLASTTSSSAVSVLEKERILNSLAL